MAEREQGGFDGFLLAPVDRTALFVAKATVLFCFLVAVELVAVPAFAILLLGPSPWAAACRSWSRCCCWPTPGIAVVGTLVGALGVQTRARELIVPILALPLMIPLVIAAARGDVAAAGSRRAPAARPGPLAAGARPL